MRVFPIVFLLLCVGLFLLVSAQLPDSPERKAARLRVVIGFGSLSILFYIAQRWIEI